MALTRTARVAAFSSAVALSLAVLTGCSSDDSTPATVDASSVPATAMSSQASTEGAPALVGAGCAAYAEAHPTGPASVDALATQPLATAAGNVPLLATLTQAVSGKLNPDVDLVATLNDGQYTVFAPTDDAFAKLPAETVEKLKTDSALLTKILTFHVVSGQAAPNAVVGEHKTLEGSMVAVTGSGDDLKVGEANVVCGGIKTANATVYLIDSVLVP